MPIFEHDTCSGSGKLMYDTCSGSGKLRASEDKIRDLEAWKAHNRALN